MRLSLNLCALGLLTAEFLWPVEDAVNGSGLHLVVLWLVLGLLHSLRVLRNNRSAPAAESRTVPFSWTDSGILLIAAGHVVSTVWVFNVSGDRRSALNLTMEWFGLLAAWYVFRSLLSDRVHALQAVRLIGCLAVGLSAYGVWQHHVFYPEQSAWYRGQRALLDDALQKNAESGFLQVSKIVSEFQSQGIPLNGPERVLWENRLLSSTEPFATFSLANTLAGILAVVLVLVIGRMMDLLSAASARRTPLAVAVLLAQCCLIGYCLVLTKSRSAWAGALTGGLILFLARSGRSSFQQLLKWCIAGGVTVGLIAGGAFWFGVLDKEVVLESPRSLQFRLLYWTGTLQMLREHAIVGAGPGNFRQVYLEHKAAESSEEIRDPHNFLLDAWSAGGVTALAGILIFVAGTLRSLVQPTQEVLPAEGSRREGKWSGIIPASAMCIGFLLHVGWEWVNGESLAEKVWPGSLLLLGVILPAFEQRNPAVALSRTTSFSASAAMMINLLAAGGFGMPAVMHLLLVCTALGCSSSLSTSDVRGSLSRRLLSVVAGLICFLGAVIVLKLGLVPVIAVERQLAMADDFLHRQRNSRAALAGYRQATLDDAFSVSPFQRVAELETFRLQELTEFKRSLSQRAEVPQADLEAVEETVRAALEACDALILADRRSSFSVRMRAECLALAAELLDSRELLEDAVAERKRVVTMYPTSVDDWVRLARTCERDSDGRWRDSVLVAAQNALRLDEINRNWGHRDLFLSEETLKEMKGIIVRKGE